METGFEGFPLIVGWELTLRCDLRCAHCGSSAGKPRPDELTTHEALAVCAQFPALLVREVDFTGGEPLLRPDWPEIAETLVQLGIQVNILTNGLNLRKEDVALMKQVGVSCVGLSLDGLEHTHNRVRNHRGAFAAVLRSIELVLNAGFLLNVITTVNALNLCELPMIAKLLESVGVKMWRLQPLIPMGRAQGNSQLAISRSEIRQLGQFIREQRLLPGGELQVICADGLQYVAEDLPGDRPWRGCSAGIAACGITSDGQVKGCLSLPDEFVEGNIRERNLWSIWFDDGAFSYTRRFSVDWLGKNCQGCPRGADCLGGCSSSSYCSTGWFHNDPMCYLSAAQEEATTTLI